jgi:hypothetical protein
MLRLYYIARLVCLVHNDLQSSVMQNGCSGFWTALMFYIIATYKMHLLVSVYSVNKKRTLHQFRKHEHPASVAELVIS